MIVNLIQGLTGVSAVFVELFMLMRGTMTFKGAHVAPRPECFDDFDTEVSLTVQQAKHFSKMSHPLLTPPL